MTNSAIMMNEERAVMAANTALVGVRMSNGEHIPDGHTSKVYILPHLQSALLFRGAVAFGAPIWMAVLLSGAETVDEAARSVWPDLDDELHKALGQLDAPDSLQNFEAILAGWSPERESMVAYPYGPGRGQSPDAEALFEFIAPLPGTLAGVHEKVERFRGMAPSIERVLQITRYQTEAMCKADREHWGFGGHANVVEIDRHGIHTTLRRDEYEGLGETGEAAKRSLLSAASKGQPIRASGL